MSSMVGQSWRWETRKEGAVGGAGRGGPWLLVLTRRPYDFKRVGWSVVPARAARFGYATALEAPFVTRLLVTRYAFARRPRTGQQDLFTKCQMRRHHSLNRKPPHRSHPPRRTQALS